MSEDLKENVTRHSIWLRLVFMIVLGVAFNVAEFVTFVVIAFQFLVSLFTGQPNDQLSRFGLNLARYLQQIIVFMTFATEEKPFPFTPWPDEPHEETLVGKQSNPLNDTPEDAGDEVDGNQTGKSAAGKTKKRTTRSVPKTQKPRTSRKNNS